MSASITNPSTHLDDARLLVVSMILLFPNVLDRADDQQPILDLISQTKLLEHQLQGRLERHTVQVDAHGRD